MLAPQFFLACLVAIAEQLHLPIFQNCFVNMQLSLLYPSLRTIDTNFRAFMLSA